MDIVRRGPDPYRVAVVYCLHGDERFPKHAADEVLSELGTVERGIKFVFANEEAFEANARFLDEDLNRAFPGDADSASHERRLAARLMDELRHTAVLDLHSTVSYRDPVGFIKGRPDEREQLALKTGVSRVVNVESGDSGRYFVGSLIEHLNAVAVECGERGNKRTKHNAKRTIEQFLIRNDAIPGRVKAPETVSFYRVIGRIDRPELEFTAENFSKVETGEPYARDDGEIVSAEREFYPILMSSDGYEDALGYMGEKCCEISSTGSYNSAP